MAALTANDYAQQMIAQARVLDPSFSGEVGTPERKIIDTVAQALADNQIDLTGLQGALDIDSKFGTNLDRFTALFGFQRQQPVTATGYVVFSRNTPAPAQVTIPLGSTIQANTSSVQYTTTTAGFIALNETDSGAVPVRAVTAGTIGNTAANTLTQMVGQIVPGVTSVTNPNPLTTGLDIEDDNSYKVRFKNTWARNLAGTQSQYLALAVSGPFTTKANVIGVQSRYQEYVQVPDYDDAGNIGGVNTSTQNTLGLANQWTTALASIPYAKQLYTNVQTFVSNGQQDGSNFFYRPDTDFQFNYPALVRGDVVREAQTVVNGNQTVAPGGTLVVTSLAEVPSSGAIIVNGQLVSYTGLQSTPSIGLTGTSGCTVVDGQPVFIVPVVTSIQPNFTLLNVFNPSSPVSIPGLQALAPGDVLLTEFSYVSSASRNDLTHAVTNAVDVYVDGSNDVQSSCVFIPNLTGYTFNTNPVSPWYYENFRREGHPTKRPQLGNYFTQLFQSPVDVLPDTITINGANYYRGLHYWLVQEVSTLGGSIRARDGIEWDLNLRGDNNTAPVTPDLADGYLTPYFPTFGVNINALPTNTAVMVNDFFYDGNIVTLQSSLDASRQITTDVLVHRAKKRYFKLDITVMYSSNANFAVVNSAVQSSVQAYMDRQYFGTVLQLSTLLEIIHEVTGVDNVRWSNDLPLIPDLIRVYETDVNGNPLHGVTVDRLTTNTASVEKQTLYIVGNPQGSFVLSWTDPGLPSTHIMTTAAIPFTHGNGSPVTATDIQTAIQAAATGLGVVSGKYFGITVAQDTRPTANVPQPIQSFTITYGAVGQPYLPSVAQTITGSDYTFDLDFFLLDDELPTLPANIVTGDTVPGLIIRPRAQNTFFRPGLG